MNNLFFFVLALAVFLAAPACASEKLEGAYKARVTEVIDGDTFRARVHIWLGQDVETLVRLQGIDSPELHGKCGKETALAKRSRSYLQDMIEGKEVLLHDIKNDKYGGRILARVRKPGAREDIAAAMLTAGRARAYGGESRKNWC